MRPNGNPHWKEYLDHSVSGEQPLALGRLEVDPGGILDICICICIPIGAYRIELAIGAMEDIGALQAFEGRKVLKAIEERLKHEPTQETRHRKVLPGLKPPFASVPPIWELRVGRFRVFYDVDQKERKVFVRAVRHKPPHRTTEEII